MTPLKLLLLKKFLFVFVCFSICYFLDINVAYSVDTTNNFHVNILNEISDNFKNQASGWSTKLEGYAKTLFWLLASISLTWTAIELALKHAEFGEIIGELAKYIIFTGLFYFMLVHGPEIANLIFETFATLGGMAAGLGTGSSGLPSMNPSTVVDIGLNFYDNVNSQLDWGLYSMASDLIQSAIAIVFFIFCLIIAIKVLIQLIALWCYMYAGAFLLGFGGSKWHRDISVNYFKGILYASVKYFAMLFIVAIMNSLMTTLIKDMNFIRPVATLQALALPIIFYLIMETVPDMIAGIVNGKFDFSSGPAASAIAGAMAGGVAGAATTSVMIAKGGVAAAKGTSKAIDYMSNHSVSDGMKDLMNNTKLGSALKSAGNNVKDIGKATSNVATGAMKATSKTLSATAGFASHTMSKPIDTAKSVASKGLSAGKSSLVAGYKAMQSMGTNLVEKAKNSVSENIAKPFQQGKDAATFHPQNQSSNNSGNAKNE